MAADDFYEGDLLSAVMTSRTPWADMPATARELHSIVSGLKGLDPWLQEQADTFLDAVADL